MVDTTVDITINKAVVSLVRGDITNETLDAIVNAANSRLAGGGGVDGAIHKAGGSLIMEECRKIGGCKTGDAVITTGGNLKAKFVIHAVGPVYRDGKHGEDKLLASAYKRSLEIASARGLRSIAFPSISTGAYGYPVDEASQIALKTIIDFAKANTDIKIVRFVLFSERDMEVYKNTLYKLTTVE
ncbi:MAG: O-acetyl-ADP-ribose deacetylase [Deltaproteobacteria bacterium GWC2_42_11]|nr:MAG: O-acetyl-ADP-ribose deacetylase [Deltaproteobacteria bacterium GWC2_42_11]HBO84550.1 O-acetyl-ADP-ribose deacetylase [Deltaproteobacteria bacterium]